MAIPGVTGAMCLSFLAGLKETATRHAPLMAVSRSLPVFPDGRDQHIAHITACIAQRCKDTPDCMLEAFNSSEGAVMVFDTVFAHKGDAEVVKFFAELKAELEAAAAAAKAAADAAVAAKAEAERKAAAASAAGGDDEDEDEDEDEDSDDDGAPKKKPAAKKAPPKKKADSDSDEDEDDDDD